MLLAEPDVAHEVKRHQALHGVYQLRVVEEGAAGHGVEDRGDQLLDLDLPEPLDARRSLRHPVPRVAGPGGCGLPREAVQEVDSERLMARDAVRVWRRPGLLQGRRHHVLFVDRGLGELRRNLGDSTQQHRRPEGRARPLGVWDSRRHA
ncbi:hypothetical protein [Kitasatospora sp. NPDC088346]|uniref:hypothetical protein n=1 Tax=Kitasatospora sp. NPDC088346 TaxID=3364073 RepID=UPI00380E1CB9